MLTRRLRMMIRRAQGRGYQLPTSHMYTPRYGVVRDTPKTRALYYPPPPPPQIVVTELPGAGVLTGLIHRARSTTTDANRLQQSQTYEKYGAMFTDEGLGTAGIEEDVPVAPNSEGVRDPMFPLNDSDLLLSQLIESASEMTPPDDLYRISIAFTTISYNDQSMTLEKRYQHFHVNRRVAVGVDDVTLESQIRDRYEEMINRIRGSSYLSLLWVASMTIHFFVYRPIRGGSYFDFSQKIKSSKV